METITELPAPLIKTAEDLELSLTLVPKADYPNGLSRDYTYGPWYVAYMQRERTVVPNEAAVMRELGLGNQFHPVLELLPEALCFAETVPQRKAVTQIRERALAEVNNPDRTIVAVVINDREPNRLATSTYPERVRMGSYVNRTHGKQHASRLVGYLAWDTPTENTDEACVQQIDVGSLHAREVLTAHYFPQLQPASIAVLHHANCDTAIMVYDRTEPAFHPQQTVAIWDDPLAQLVDDLPKVTPLPVDGPLATYQAAVIALRDAESALADVIITHQPDDWKGTPSRQVAQARGVMAYKTSDDARLAAKAIRNAGRGGV